MPIKINLFFFILQILRLNNIVFEAWMDASYYTEHCLILIALLFFSCSCPSCPSYLHYALHILHFSHILHLSFIYLISLMYFVSFMYFLSFLSYLSFISICFISFLWISSGDSIECLYPFRSIPLHQQLKGT
jgi:hypothetical protein